VLAAVAVRPMAMGVEASLEVLGVGGNAGDSTTAQHRIPARIVRRNKSLKAS
jgi:hypothetical protein